MQVNEPVTDPRIEARMALIRGRVERSLDEAGGERVRERVRRSIEMVDALRAVPLANGDQPAGDFLPIRAERSE